MRIARGVRATALAGAAALALAACVSEGGGDDDEAAAAGGDSSADAAWEPEYVDGVLQPLPSGFPDGDLTILNADEPGSDDGLYARTMQSLLDQISPVPVQVLDRPSPTHGTWEAIQFVEGQQGGDEGRTLVVGAMTGSALDLLTVPITDELGMDIDDWNPVIVTETSPFVLATRKDAPWDDYEGFVEWAKANPGEARFASRVGSQLEIAMMRLIQEGGYEVEVLPVEDLEVAATTVGAGEADITMLLPGTAQSHYQAGRIDVMLTIGNEPADAFPEAQTTADIGLPDEPWGSVRGLLIPASVPDEHRDWLYELFKTAAETEDYAQRISDLPGAIGVTYTHDEVMEIVTNTLEFAEPVVRELGLHYDQQ
jgi:tripartite-type tricarboxylate transporter receptor subunit TctC